LPFFFSKYLPKRPSKQLKTAKNSNISKTSKTPLKSITYVYLTSHKLSKTAIA
jgi:hypothetical protein